MSAAVHKSVSARAAHPGSAGDSIDEPERWLSFFARNICSYRLTGGSLGGSNPRGAQSRSVADFTLTSGVTEGRYRLRRDATEIAADRKEHFGLYISVRGEMTMTQFGRPLTVVPGTFGFVSAADPSMHETSGGNASICFLMPREFVDRRVHDSEAACARRYGNESGLHGLVVDTLSAFEKHAWRITDDEFEKTALVIADLVLLGLRSVIDLQSGERSVRSANLSRVKRIIRRRLADADLTLADVAREVGLSLSYAHELFRDSGEGGTMQDYLRGQRLRRAYELLEISSLRGSSVTEIALECGFSNMSHFSTSFKRAFGVSPRDVARGRELK